MGKQKTISKSATVEGIGMFSAKPCTLEFAPAEAGTGIVFVRTDLNPQVEIPSLVDFAVTSNRCTVLENNGARVETVEHVLSALYGLQITDVRVYINAAEPPNIDGSPKAFVDALLQAGICERNKSVEPLTVTEPITVSDGDAMICLMPSDNGHLDILYELDYSDVPAIGRQMNRFRLGQDDYASEIGPCRTFLRKAEADAARAQGIGAHLTEQDILVFDDEGPIGNALHCDDEPVRHKVCDLIGDLALLGKPLAGRLVASRSGHELNRKLVREILAATTPAKPAAPAMPLMDIRKIMDFLPHRYPFLMVDKVLEIEANKRAVAVKNVTINEPFFQGHYPGEPIMPGVMIVEALAQLSGILMGQELETSEKVAVLLGIDAVKLRKAVRPGDQLILESEALRVRGRIGHCKCKASVDGEIVAEAEVKFMLVDASKV